MNSILYPTKNYNNAYLQLSNIYGNTTEKLTKLLDKEDPTLFSLDDTNLPNSGCI